MFRRTVKFKKTILIVINKYQANNDEILDCDSA